MGRKRGHERLKKDFSMKCNLEIPNPYIIRSVSKSESDESDVFENSNRMSTYRPGSNRDLSCLVHECGRAENKSSARSLTTPDQKFEWSKWSTNTL